jgi:glycosyltransferase involved in cell wall biosynthesis
MKRILIISYYYPPLLDVGALRALGFSRYLPEYGWQPYVVSVKNPDPDYCLLGKESFPSHVQVFYTRSLVNLARLNGLANGFLCRALGLLGKNHSQNPADIFFLPDIFVGWTPLSLWTAYRLIRRYKINVIYVSAKPFSSTLTGAVLKRLTGKFLILDFRDPMSLEAIGVDAPEENGLYWSAIRRLEKLVLSQADWLLVTSQRTREQYLSLYPFLKDKCSVIYNGYLDELLPAGQGQGRATSEERGEKSEWRGEDGEESSKPLTPALSQREREIKGSLSQRGEGERGFPSQSTLHPSSIGSAARPGSQEKSGDTCLLSASSQFPVFSIIYTGNFYPTLPGADVFFQGLQQVLAEGKILREKIRFFYFGNNEEWFQGMKEKYCLHVVIKHCGYTNRKQALQYISNASLFLLRSRGNMISAKLYEALAIGKPILSLDSTDEVAQLIRNYSSNFSLLFPGDGSEKVAEAIYNAYIRWESGDWPAIPNEAYLQRFNKRHLTHQLACILEKAC